LAEELVTGFMLAIVVGVLGAALEVLPMPEKADVVGLDVCAWTGLK
jgi:hypothetical protein